MERLEELRALYKAREVEKGIALYRDLVAEGTVSPEVYLFGARLYRLDGDPWRSLRALEQAKAGCPTGAILGQVLFTRGYLLREIGAPAEAIEQLEECAERFPEYAELGAELLGPLWYNTGLAYRQMKRYPNAIAAYEGAANHFRHAGMEAYLCMCLHNLAWACCLQGSLQMAEESLREADPLCTTDVLRHHQRLGKAFLDAVTPGANLPQVIKECMGLMQQGADLPPDVASHTCWLVGKAALAMDLLDKAMAMADMAVHFGTMARGENRCLQDASELRRDVAVAMGLIQKPTGS